MMIIMVLNVSISHCHDISKVNILYIFNRNWMSTAYSSSQFWLYFESDSKRMVCWRWRRVLLRRWLCFSWDCQSRLYGNWPMVYPNTYVQKLVHVKKLVRMYNIYIVIYYTQCSVQQFTLPLIRRRWRMRWKSPVSLPWKGNLYRHRRKFQLYLQWWLHRIWHGMQRWIDRILFSTPYFEVK